MEKVRFKVRFRKARNGSRFDINQDLITANLSNAVRKVIGVEENSIVVFQREDGTFLEFIVKTSTENINDDVIMLSRSYLDLKGISVGEGLQYYSSRRLPDLVESISFEYNGSSDGLNSPDRKLMSPTLPKDLSKELDTLRTFTCGISVERPRPNNPAITDKFTISMINGLTEAVLYKFNLSKAPPVELPDALKLVEDFRIPLDNIGGLSKQLEDLNDRLAEFSNGVKDLKHFVVTDFAEPLSNGILLTGLAGVGKSLILDEVSKRPFQYKKNINASDIDGDELAQILRQAASDAPSLVTIDGLDVLAPSQADSKKANSLIQNMLISMDFLKSKRVIVLATTTNPNKIDASIRKFFDISIDLTAPSAQSRAEILKILCQKPKTEPDLLLDEFASKTHGFVGSDLREFLRRAAHTAKTRAKHDPNYQDQDGKIQIQFLRDDLQIALSQTRPSALKEVIFETPNVRWSDIGGQEATKQMLIKSIEWPLKYPLKMKKVGRSNPKRGLLLYGPPGCSKTLTAKALAGESGINFISVSGAELLNSYVGESERAIRELFRKARAASPCIIFFDEIDAIATKREVGSGNGVQVLTTLLTEMDGMQDSKNVFVLAATNRPHILDPALLRPGRLDEKRYVGVPDTAGRKAILEIHLRKNPGIKLSQIDLDELAALTKDCSGAEIVEICQTAGDMALERYLKQNPDVEDGDDEKLQVTLIDFKAAAKEMPRGITPEMLIEYNDFE